MTDTKLTRRQMCRLLAAAPAAAVLGAASSSAAEKKPFALRYILGSSMYGTLKLEEILPEVHKIGARHIDVWPLRHGDQREQIEAMGHDRFAELLDKNGVKLGMSTRYDLGPFGLGEEMKFLKKFGGRVLISGSRGPKNVAGAEAKQPVKDFVEQMKPHAAAAEALGLRIGIENHGNALIASEDSLRYLAEFATSPGLGIALAPYHLPQDEAVLARLIEDLGPKLVHFYAWQHGQGCKKKPCRQSQGTSPAGKAGYRRVEAARAGAGLSGGDEKARCLFAAGLVLCW